MKHENENLNRIDPVEICYDVTVIVTITRKFHIVVDREMDSFDLELIASGEDNAEGVISCEGDDNFVETEYECERVS